MSQEIHKRFEPSFCTTDHFIIFHLASYFLPPMPQSTSAIAIWRLWCFLTNIIRRERSMLLVGMSVINGDGGTSFDINNNYPTLIEKITSKLNGCLSYFSLSWFPHSYNICLGLLFMRGDNTAGSGRLKIKRKPRTFSAAIKYCYFFLVVCRFEPTMEPRSR